MSTKQTRECNTNNKTGIALMGASGRMGRMLIEAVLADNTAVLFGAFVRQDSSLVGADAGELIGASCHGVALSALSPCAAQVVIDFSLPKVLQETLKYCTDHKKALVLGVTGLSTSQEKQLNEAGKHIPIVYAGNYSTGVNLSLSLLKQAAQVLGMAADIEITERHHRHKLDAPSGTALMMAKAVTTGRNQSMEALVHGRQGKQKRQTGEIGMHAIRGGEIVGEHTVEFVLNHERFEISHKAQSRAVFAEGAVRAAHWVKDKVCGVYDMCDVLGLDR